ncbi:MAG: threonine/serine exporter ThrE family protein [Actinomycetales bacterium]
MVHLPNLRWRRLLGQEVITEPLPVISRLRNTPYRDPRRGVSEDDTRSALALVADIGEALMRSGAGTEEVSTSMLAAGVSLGLDEDYLWSDIMLGSIFVSYGRPGEWPLTTLRVTRHPYRDYARLSATHDMVLRLCDGELSIEQTRAELAHIESAPRPYKRWWVTVAFGVLASAVVLVLGGGPVVSGTAFVVTCLVDQVGRWAGRRGWPSFFVTFTGASLAATSAVALAEASQRWPIGIDSPQNSSLVIAGGIIVLLAGVGLVAAGQDGINGYPVTAIGRLFEVMLTTSAILAGVGSVLAIASSFSLAGTIFTNPLAGFVSGLLWWSPMLAAVGAICSAIGGRSPARLLFVTGLTGAFGYAVYLLSIAVGLPNAVGAALACVLIGAFGRVSALRRRASPLAVVIPATTMLLPGMSIFQGLQYLTSGDSAAGIVTLLSAAATALGIGAGCVVGDLLAAPLEAGMTNLEEIRQRTRQDM